MALTDKLSAIGSAIREKTGKSDLLTLDAMPEEIRSIEGGGSGDSSVYEDGWMNKTFPSGDYYNDRITGDIKDYLFAYNDTLTSISMPNTTRIETGAFYYCSNLAEIDFPNVDYAGSQAFSYTALKNVYLPKLSQLNGSVFIRCEQMETICLPVATTSYQSALNFCTSLWKADFPKMQNIVNIFSGCQSLTALILRADSICNLSSSSNLSATPINSGTGFIYVPRALIEEYKTATNWTTYASQFRAIEDYPDICGEVEQ